MGVWKMRHIYTCLSKMTFSSLLLWIYILVLRTSQTTGSNTTTSEVAATTTRATTITTNLTTTLPSTDDSGNVLPQIAIVVVVIAVIVLIGIGISKCAEYCYERSSIRDDASDISEDTKAVLKFHIQLMKDKKKRDESENKSSKTETATKKVLKIWGKGRVKSEDDDDAGDDDDDKNANTTKVPTISVENGATLHSQQKTPIISVNIVNENVELESIDSKESEKALLQVNSRDEKKADSSAVTDKLSPEDTARTPEQNEDTCDENQIAESNKPTKVEEKEVTKQTENTNPIVKEEKESGNKQARNIVKSVKK